MNEYNQDQLVDTNQTEFSSVEPLFEKPPVDPATLVPKPAPKSHRVLMFVIGGVVVVVLLIIVLVVLLSRRQMLPTLLPQPTPTPSTQLDPLRQEVVNLRTELEAADPTKQELPFPPVDLDIFLEQQRPQ
jgi:hypothetical protein